MIENNLVNKELLLQYKTKLETLPLWKSVKNLDKSDKTSEQYCMKLTSINIDNCFEMLEQGQSITTQLEDIRIDVDNYWYDEECNKPIVDIPIKNLKDLLQQFKFDNYQQELSNFIKQNVDWRKKDRDFKIYKKIKSGTLYSEIAEGLGCSVSAISKINKKVQVSINNRKGRFFEIKYEKYLKILDIFRNAKIVRDGKPGQPDIYIMTKKRELFVLSLKNLELNKDSYTIIKDHLKAEYQFAYLNNSFKEVSKVVLYLIVFDSLKKKLHIKELDFKKPSNVNIYR